MPVTVTGLPTPRPPGQLEVRLPQCCEFESNSLSGTCSGMDSTVWMKVQALVYVFGIYLHVYVLYVHVCVCMSTNLNKIWLSMECSYVYDTVCICMYALVCVCV